jgi:hypothetical protein
MGGMSSSSCCTAAAAAVLVQAALFASAPPVANCCSKCPSRSDVVFTSRSPRYSPGDPVQHQTTWQAMAGFNATRLDWVYTANASFVAEAHAHGMQVSHTA